MVDRIIGNKGLGPLGSLGRTDRAVSPQKNAAGKHADRVDFSSALTNAEKAQSAGSVQETARQEKIAALKSQIQEGSYKPDLTRVAASLLPVLMKDM